jgi:hypothetical protein
VGGWESTGETTELVWPWRRRQQDSPKSVTNNRYGVTYLKIFISIITNVRTSHHKNMEVHALCNPVHTRILDEVYFGISRTEKQRWRYKRGLTAVLSNTSRNEHIQQTVTNMAWNIYVISYTLSELHTLSVVIYLPLWHYWLFIRDVNERVMWIFLQRRCDRRTANISGCRNNYILGTVATSQCQVSLVFCL